MKSVEKTLEYHELLMVCNDLTNIKEAKLPGGFSFVFWNKDETDEDCWCDIHIKSGEFTAVAYAHSIFEEFYHSFKNELNKRCFFIINDKGEKVATAAVSPTNEHGYNCVVDWLAITKEYQGKGLAKPLIAKTLQLAKGLGYNKILLHTQTHSWLAAKLYLDLGFTPFNITADIKGWQILKTITNHEQLKDIPTIPEKKIYFKTALNIVKQLNKLHKNYEYQIWHKNGRHEVWVRENNNFYAYLYYFNGRILKPIKRKFVGFVK